MPVVAGAANSNNCTYVCTLVDSGQENLSHQLKNKGDQKTGFFNCCPEPTVAKENGEKLLRDIERS